MLLGIATSNTGTTTTTTTTTTILLLLLLLLLLATGYYNSFLATSNAPCVSAAQHPRALQVATVQRSSAQSSELLRMFR